MSKRGSGFVYEWRGGSWQAHYRGQGADFHQLQLDEDNARRLLPELARQRGVMIKIAYCNGDAMVISYPDNLMCVITADGRRMADERTEKGEPTLLVGAIGAVQMGDLECAEWSAQLVLGRALERGDQWLADTARQLIKAIEIRRAA